MIARKQRPRRRHASQSALVEEDIEAAKVGDRLFNGLDAVRLALQVEREEEGLAETVRLLINVVAHVLGILLLLRQVDDRAAGTEDGLIRTFENRREYGSRRLCVAYTLAPSYAARMAAERPIPESPPVMSQTFPSNLPVPL